MPPIPRAAARGRRSVGSSRSAGWLLSLRGGVAWGAIFALAALDSSAASDAPGPAARQLRSAGPGPATREIRTGDSAAVLSPELAEQLARAAATSQVGFVAVLRTQADPLVLRIETERVARTEGRRAARAHGCQRLKQLARASQSAPLAYLEQRAWLGQVEEHRALWIANAIAGRATPEAIAGLAELPEIALLLWNPAVDVAQQLDEVVPGGGLRAAPAGAEGDAGLRPVIGWHLQRVGAPQAWAQGYTGAGVVVGVIDTGVDYTHPDLAGHLWVNEDEVPWNGIDDDFNGYVDDTLGWNFVMNNNNPMGAGASDHGTRAAGVVAGDGTSGTATGVAPQALIMSLKAAGSDWGDVVEAIQYAGDNGADVISMSLTQKWSSMPKPNYAFWRQITDNELAVGMLHANSIGNSGDEINVNPIPFNIGVPGSCPSAWVHPDQYLAGGVSAVLAVGSVDSLSVLSDFSSRGPFAWENITAVWPQYIYAMPPAYRDYPYSTGDGGLIKPDLLAPGEDVLSTRLGGGYLTFNGTSAACPHVSGALALLAQARPGITPAEAALALQLGAVDLGPPGKDNDYGAGLLNLPAAIHAAISLDNLASIRGTVIDAATGDSLSFAGVTILETAGADTTNAAGGYALYGVRPGMQTLEARRFGYFPDTAVVATLPGATVTVDFHLAAWPTGELSGVVRDADSGAPIAGARVEVPGALIAPRLTGPDGAFVFADFPAETLLAVQVVHFGHHRAAQAVAVPESGQATIEFELAYGVRDDFEIDQGWRIGHPTDTATDGIWVRCDPTGIWRGALPIQPEDDHTPDPGRICFVTGNGVPGAGENQNDVDGGRTTLTSPHFDGAWYWRPMVSFWLWYSNDGSFYVDDTLRVEISWTAGRTWEPLLTTHTAFHAWTHFSFALEELVTLSDSMCVRFIAADRGRDSSVEVAVDDFDVTGIPFASVNARAGPTALSFAGAQPSPLVPGGALAFTLPRPGTPLLELYDPVGRRVRRLGGRPLDAGEHRFIWDGADDGGRPCPRGVYLARLHGAGEVRSTKVVLVR